MSRRGCSGALLWLLLAACVPSGNDNSTLSPKDNRDYCLPPTAQPLRRLTHTEYLNSISDVFEMVSPDELRLVADPYGGYYDNNLNAQSVSGLLISDYHLNAKVVARKARENLPSLLPCNPSSEQACLRELISVLGRRLFRRPLTSEEISAFSSFYDSGPLQGDFGATAQLAIQIMLESPDFLYRPEFGVSETNPQLAPFERATRMSYLLWASGPDDVLLDAAEKGELETDAQLAAQVDRMLVHEKARRGLLRFTDQWLKLKTLEAIGKDPSENFDALKPSLAESLQRFVWAVLERGGTQEELLTSNTVWVDDNLAPLLGVSADDQPWREAQADPNQRAGILTHPAFLATHGYPGYPSPVLRGVFVLERFLCNPPPPPPAGVTQAPPPASEMGRPLTNREGYDRVTRQAGDTCATCHSLINPLGFAFENYDTLGRYRTEDEGQPVDASGSWGENTFNNAIELSRQLAQSDQVTQCISRHWIEYAVANSALAQDLCFREDVVKSYEASGRTLIGLVRAIALHPKFARPAVIQE